MKKLYWTGIIGFILFEIANVFFIMPMPGSQEMNSIDLAYYLYSWRWVFRILFVLLIIVGFIRSHWRNKWIPLLFIIISGIIAYMANYKMAADKMFLQPETISLVNHTENKVDTNRLIIGVVENGIAKAYPIQFLGYHHQVQDSINGNPILVTYCTVCRTGRVFHPIVNGKPEQFRLVGMDHYNAMLEDASTKSWWRQATGEAISGKLKGTKLEEVFSYQTSLGSWIRLHPNTLIMQADPAFVNKYDSTFKYESGESRKKLTGTDSLSGQKKSWVIGVTSNGSHTVFDWNQLKKERILYGKLNQTPVSLLLANDDKSFFAFALNNQNDSLQLHQDTILFKNRSYNLEGIGIDTVHKLERLAAYQEFWHSWQTFHPEAK